MKLCAWIRPDGKGGVRLRTDFKTERDDTPRIAGIGHAILSAMNGEDGYATREDKAIASRDALRTLLEPAAKLDLSNLPDLSISAVSGNKYAFRACEWKQLSVVLDCVNAVRNIQKGLNDERKSH